jgi:hypothetical protein
MIIALSVFVFASAQKESQWKGKIEYEDGVKVIKNPSEPLYGEITFELEEDLSIGNEEDENYMFYEAFEIAVDSKKNILVLDSGNNRVQKYDEKGNFLQTIGRKGQGPGEFEDPTGIILDSKDRVYVLELRKMHIFDKNGDFIETVVLDCSIRTSGITKEENILAYSVNYRPEEKHDIVLISLEGKKIKTIASRQYEASMPLGARASLSLLSEKCGVFGYLDEYKLFVINSLGEASFIIEKKELPTSDQFFTQINTDEIGNIYVIKWEGASGADENAYIDLFNRNGYYLYKIKIYGSFPLIIRKGYIYKIEYGREGYAKIKRYKIKNWGKIKEGP